jgi:tetratricopeptide (TPR) repeat protein
MRIGMLATKLLAEKQDERRLHALAVTESLNGYLRQSAAERLLLCNRFDLAIPLFLQWGSSPRFPPIARLLAANSLSGTGYKADSIGILRSLAQDKQVDPPVREKARQELAAHGIVGPLRGHRKAARPITDPFDVQFRQAMAHLRYEKYDEALAALTDCLRARPEDARLWYLKGVVLNKRRSGESDLRGGLEAFDRCVQLHPDSWDAWRMRALVLAELGRTADALDSVEKAIAGHPEDAAAWALGAKLHSAQGNADRALAFAERASQLDPGNEEYARLTRMIQTRSQPRDNDP